ncbi:WD40/YVTN repeat-like-containing domain [Phytophthora cinnamomi]|uniref:WD40/YVTN repeat-like-containing domain n=1 Tax=Phytophthora cinnamomi TaxID=4785 RepID=UPI003559EFB8|nr:WD40/YVTN repeat-like-containing domain [Phytophthora cinnamomi]
MNFLTERERIYKHPDCRCASHSHSQSKKSSSASTGGVNWRRNVAHDYLKRKQLKRRHKKAFAAKLQQLHASYAVQIQELLAVQRMQANALRARQQVQHLHLQFRRHASKAKSASPSSPSSPSTVASPIKHSALPNHLSDLSYPYPDLLS